tara:strand:+ start:278 stop:514 length:237 start_codon:yes stop_codon:yes gene_type:complete
MKTVTFTEFRKHASELFSDVEQGEKLVVVRHGKPIAEISPVATASSQPAWKQPALRLSSEGTGLSAAIVEDRADEDVL